MRSCAQGCVPTIFLNKKYLELSLSAFRSEREKEKPSLRRFFDVLWGLTVLWRDRFAGGLRKSGIFARIPEPSEKKTVRKENRPIPEQAVAQSGKAAFSGNDFLYREKGTIEKAKKIESK